MYYCGPEVIKHEVVVQHHWDVSHFNDLINRMTKISSTYLFEVRGKGSDSDISGCLQLSPVLTSSATSSDLFILVVTFSETIGVTGHAQWGLHKTWCDIIWSSDRRRQINTPFFIIYLQQGQRSLEQLAKQICSVMTSHHNSVTAADADDGLHPQVKCGRRSHWCPQPWLDHMKSELKEIRDASGVAGKEEK